MKRSKMSKFKYYLLLITLIFLSVNISNISSFASDADTPYMLELKAKEDYETLGFMYYLDKKYELAIDTLNKALISPKATAKEYVYNSLGLAYMDMGKDEEAISNYLKACEMNPKYSTPYYNMGVYYYQKGDFPKAIENFEKNVELGGEDYSCSLNYIGIIYSNEGLYDKAIDAFKRGIDLGSDNADLFYNLADIYRKQKNYPLAIQNYEKTLKLTPDDNDAKIHLSQSLSELSIDLVDKGLFNIAIQNINKSILLDKNNAINYFLLGDVHSSLRHYDLSIQNYLKALSLCNGNEKLKALIYDGLALVYSYQGQTDKAIKYYEYSISLCSTNKTAYHNLGVLYRKKGLYQLSNIYFKQEQKLNN